MSSGLDALRLRIDELTRQLVTTVERRAVVASTIAEWKRREGLPARDRLREERLLEATLSRAEGVLTKRSLLAILHQVMDVGLAQRGVGSERALAVIHAAPRDLPFEWGRIIAGPRAVESEAQIESVASRVASLGVTMLQGDAFGTSVSPYAFPGLGLRGVELLSHADHRNGMRCLTEVIDTRDVEAVAEHVDVIRVGARSMQNVALLREVARMGRPLILERAVGASVHEWLCAAEQIARAGDATILLAERAEPGSGSGVALDLAGVAELKEESGLPVIVDVGRAGLRRQLALPLARAALAVGADAVALSVHPDPDAARVDSASHLDFDGFDALLRRLPDTFRELARELDATPPTSVVTPPLHAIQAERNAS